MGALAQQEPQTTHVGKWQFYTKDSPPPMGWAGGEPVCLGPTALFLLPAASNI